MSEREVKESSDQSPVTLKILLSVISLGVLLVILRMFEII